MISNNFLKEKEADKWPAVKCGYLKLEEAQEIL